MGALRPPARVAPEEARVDRRRKTVALPSRYHQRPVCSRGLLSTTEIQADGTLVIADGPVMNPDAPFDCFVVQIACLALAEWSARG